MAVIVVKDYDQSADEGQNVPSSVRVTDVIANMASR
jgi:hypothetical protein